MLKLRVIAFLDLVFSMEKRKYLSEESSRIAVINGIGSEYFPKLDLLERYKKLIFIENDSDKKILEILGEQCGILLPNDVVYWTNTDSHQDRRHMFEELRKIIPSLKCISLRDRDMDNPNSIGDGLEYKTISLPADSPILLLEWRRKNIESYLLCPKAIAAATEKEVDEVKKYLSCKFAIAISDDGFVDANPPEAIITLDGKNVFIEESIGLEAHYNCNKYDVAKKMSSEEICQDIKTFLTSVFDKSECSLFNIICLTAKELSAFILREPFHSVIFITRLFFRQRRRRSRAKSCTTARENPMTIIMITAWDFCCFETI